MDNRPICIYHGENCVDGFTAAWLYRKVHPDAEFVAASYKDGAPDTAGRHVAILDFSYSRSQIIEMRDGAKGFILLDHHKTAVEELRVLDLCILDPTKSGARLTFEHFFREPDLPLPDAPWLVDYTEDRDLWKWELPASKEINAAIRSYPMTFESWDFLSTLRRDRLIAEGAAILRDQEQTVKRHVEAAQLAEIAGAQCYCVNATALISEIGHALAIDKPFSVTWRQEGWEYIYSLRSTEEGWDVSEIAKLYCGGGHKHAAGFRSLLPPRLIFHV